MSISATININLARHKSQDISTFEIIKVLKDFGWSLTHDGYTSYLPLGDKDDFEWQSKKNMNFDSVKKLILMKESSEELIGIILTWQTSDIGGVFLFDLTEYFQ